MVRSPPSVGGSSRGMTRTAEADQGRIDDMLDMLRDIREHLRGGWELFQRDKDAQKVVAYDLMIIGEAATKVSRRTQASNPSVPWSKLASYRNSLIHGYGSLDLKDTWEFVQHELRGLERRLARVRVPSGGEESQ